MKKSIIIICLLGVILTAAVTSLKWRQISDATPTVTEINFVDGVTSAIQAQLNSKVDTIDLVNPWPDIRDTITARLDNTPLTGIPTAPTATLGTTTTQLATMAALDEAIKKSGLMRRVCQNNVKVFHTGDAVETTVLTMTIPANSIGLNGSFHILPLYSVTGSASKTFRIKFNGVVVGTVILTTTSVSGQFCHIIRSRNSNTAHVSTTTVSTSGGQFANSTSDIYLPTFDHTQEITVTVTVELVTTTEQGNVQGIEIYASY